VDAPHSAILEQFKSIQLNPVPFILLQFAEHKVLRVKVLSKVPELKGAVLLVALLCQVALRSFIFMSVNSRIKEIIEMQQEVGMAEVAENAAISHIL
jgi:uncharacterized membrane protein